MQKNAASARSLRERDVIEQLLKYLVRPPADADDPKAQYKYPFAACEVLCCEVDAVFSALAEDAALLDLLFSPLEADPPLACKAAGYFSRVAGALLLRRPTEVTRHIAAREGLLARLVDHASVASVADFLKRLAGADEASAMAFAPAHTEWLVETPLLEMLLERLGPGWPAEVSANAADVLAAIAHTQPSALSAKLMRPPSVAALMTRALDPEGSALVPALEVCGALLEPRRGGAAFDAAYGSPPPLPVEGFGFGDAGADAGADPDAAAAAAGSAAGVAAAIGAGAAAAAARQRADALRAMLVYLPQLASRLDIGDADAGRTLETSYGRLAPPLGRARIKVAELLAALLHAGDDDVDAALVAANAVGRALALFARFPFNNLLHHQVFFMLRGALARGGAQMVDHVLTACGLPGWLAALPHEVPATPPAAAGGAEAPPPRLLRAGYLGHVARIGDLLEDAAARLPAAAAALERDAAWAAFAAGELRRRRELEDPNAWACGRPTGDVMGELGSDELQNEMELDPPADNDGGDGVAGAAGAAPFHRYGALGGGGAGGDDDEDDDDDDEATTSSSDEGGAGGGGGGGGEPADFTGDYGGALAAALRGMDLNADERRAVAGASSSGGGEGSSGEGANAGGSGGDGGGGEGGGTGASSGAPVKDTVTERELYEFYCGPGSYDSRPPPKAAPGLAAAAAAGAAAVGAGAAAAPAADSEAEVVPAPPDAATGGDMADDAVLLSTSDDEADAAAAAAPAAAADAPAAAEAAGDSGVAAAEANGGAAGPADAAPADEAADAPPPSADDGDSKEQHNNSNRSGSGSSSPAAGAKAAAAAAAAPPPAAAAAASS